MPVFLEYMDQTVPLEARLEERFNELSIEDSRRLEVLSFLKILELKDRQTFRHSLRVGILASQIAEFTHISRKALLYAGLLHDVGKSQTRVELLQKTDEWTSSDAKELNSHVMDGYRLIRGHFDFSAEIILWHHRFQPRVYPRQLPPLLHEYSQGTKILIPFFGRMLSLADVYDALHRVNSRTNCIPQTGEEIKQKMLAINKDMEELVLQLYSIGVFTTSIY